MNEKLIPSSHHSQNSLQLFLYLQNGSVQLIGGILALQSGSVRMIGGILVLQNNFIQLIGGILV
ncbi:MAG: hypothetical protein AAF740_10880 [Bacteroidota bacterium]